MEEYTSNYSDSLQWRRWMTLATEHEASLNWVLNRNEGMRRSKLQLPECTGLVAFSPVIGSEVKLHTVTESKPSVSTQ